MPDKINNLREVMDIGNPSFSVQDFSNYTENLFADKCYISSNCGRCTISATTTSFRIESRVIDNY